MKNTFIAARAPPDKKELSSVHASNLAIRRKQKGLAGSTAL